ncbi:CheR family methyltransferase [Flammeovirga kamogawensis]|uniref:Protein-glutamate O-methyltransferase CheR n=1 Tax=Flammeovirga kamogawensis TaxID=373891 RepID=A0ABX8GVS5_9BACT|nr:protein-glutamate O-methyltransferase CheR [Flammeovirga kamogawensis]MBB6461642.1 chemotaxis protein methyltransferase CheR [Flammeovirga kamogawensis]QWG07431.1 protein-glutamate O-methyltransferase CheR [Flammeovirga kamogawensis]TRX69242.1 protein-glutamate O-methyltransferase CheR [Flammeovirga kamogawensis]
MQRDIEIAELRKLTTFIDDNFDYDFKNYAMSSFTRRVKRVIELYKFSSVDILIKKFKSNPSFFQEFVSEITVNVTEMFRDPTFWKSLHDDIIPEVMNEHKKISIWHAGCSSGEEVVSMCIMLEELGYLSQATIVATDIDKSIISKAKKARFTEKNMTLNQQNYERYGGTKSIYDYFIKEDNYYYIKPELIDRVSFRVQDLVKGNPFSKFDLILCRNVMIYFNQTLQNEVLKKLHNSLFKYGNLAIGSKESLIWCDIANKFVVVNNEEKIYKKIKD